jgi:hypothetical protein
MIRNEELDFSLYCIFSFLPVGMWCSLTFRFNLGESSKVLDP